MFSATSTNLRASLPVRPLALTFVSTQLLLVRHGQSEWNALGRWQGQADTSLSPLGRAQATNAARAFSGVQAVLASPLSRALETAAIMAGVWGIAQVEMAAGLIERDCGEWTGLTVAEIDERWPGDRAAWRTPPGFEPDDVVLARVHVQLAEIGRRYLGQRVVAVSHGGLMYVLSRALEGREVPIPNLGAQWIQIDGGMLALGEAVDLLADPAAQTVASEEQV